LRDVYVKRT